MRIKFKGIFLTSIVGLMSCASVGDKTSESTLGSQHLVDIDNNDSLKNNLNTTKIPDPVNLIPILPEPQPRERDPKLTAIVRDVPIADFLFNLARDSQLNLDIDPDVSGTVTMNAIDQPLRAILDRVVETQQIRYEIRHGVLRIKRNKPFFRHYRIDYLNMSRTSQSEVNVATMISSTGSDSGSDAGDSDSNNNSTTRVANTSTYNFWQSITQNIQTIIGSQGNFVGQAPQISNDSGGEGSAGNMAFNQNNISQGNMPRDQNPLNNIVVNKESGIIAVRATHKQHNEIQAFLDEVLSSVRRQVMIEATIAEVKLSDNYQAGIDWRLFANEGSRRIVGSQDMVSLNLTSRPAFNLDVSDIDFDGNLLQASISALQNFGNVKIMSSPKVMALNNQTALLKVVDNLVYFTTEVTIDANAVQNGAGSNALITYETTVNTVPVGFVMSVTPYIDEFDSVTLNIRPTISRVIDHVRDPNPDLARVNVVSEVPVIQVREVESVLKVTSGNIAVIGGLMQDDTNNTSWGIPYLSKIPILGSLFRFDDNRKVKTELVIFIKPVVVKHNNFYHVAQSE